MRRSACWWFVGAIECLLNAPSAGGLFACGAPFFVQRSLPVVPSKKAEGLDGSPVGVGAGADADESGNEDGKNGEGGDESVINMHGVSPVACYLGVND